MYAGFIFRIAALSLAAPLLCPGQQASQRFYAVAPTSGITPPQTTLPPGKTYGFDRIGNPNGITDAKVQKAIANSSALTSGTVIVNEQVKGCWTYDWTVTALAWESSNVLIFRPGDVSVFCATPPPATCDACLNPPPPTLDQMADLYVVLPVKVTWVEVTGFRGDLNDPARKTPGNLQGISSCWDLATTPAKTFPATGIQPCDVKANTLRKIYYHSGWLYNRLTAPGVWTGSFSIAPQVVANSGQTLTEDIRFYGSSKAGAGWLGLNVVFEKGASQSSNLNSLMAGLSYDLHLSKSPWWMHSPADRAHIAGLRPGELALSTGEEYTPTRTTAANGIRYKDLNKVEGVYYKQPISFTAFQYPSFVTLFPLLGAEGGWHLDRFLPMESDRFFRKVVGVDASLRYPFHRAPNFTSTKGATIDYALRERFLSGLEPYTDAGTSPNTPILSRQRRSYQRMALTWPLSNYVAINVAAQRGSLPPDFISVPWTVTLGLAFGSTGTVEH